VSIFNGDASEIYKLAADLSLVGRKTVPAMRGVMAEAGLALANDWRQNATETSGEHGKHYPASIDSELSLSIRSIGVEVGPNASKPQGGMGMGFEFGSRNQPPHLDGLRALDGIQQRVERMVDSTIGHLFP
jgi:hypothetical protein